MGPGELIPAMVPVTTPKRGEEKGGTIEEANHKETEPESHSWSCDSTHLPRKGRHLVTYQAGLGIPCKSPGGD